MRSSSRAGRVLPSPYSSMKGVTSVADHGLLDRLPGQHADRDPVPEPALVTQHALPGPRHMMILHQCNLKLKVLGRLRSSLHQERLRLR